MPPGERGEIPFDLPYWGLPPLKGEAGSLLAEGLTVGALVHGGGGLVGAHQDPVQRAEVLGVAVVGTLLDGTLDALVGVAVHIRSLLISWYTVSMTGNEDSMR